MRTVADLSRVRKYRPGPDGLTLRQMQCVDMLLGGLSNAEIGVALGLSHKTVEAHLERIKERIGAKSIRHAAAILAAERARSCG